MILTFLAILSQMYAFQILNVFLTIVSDVLQKRNMMSVTITLDCWLLIMVKLNFAMTQIIFSMCQKGVCLCAVIL